MLNLIHISVTYWFPLFLDWKKHHSIAPHSVHTKGQIKTCTLYLLKPLYWRLGEQLSPLPGSPLPQNGVELGHGLCCTVTAYRPHGQHTNIWVIHSPDLQWELMNKQGKQKYLNQNLVNDLISFYVRLSYVWFFFLLSNKNTWNGHLARKIREKLVSMHGIVSLKNHDQGILVHLQNNEGWHYLSRYKKLHLIWKVNQIKIRSMIPPSRSLLGADQRSNLIRWMKNCPHAQLWQ